MNASVCSIDGCRMPHEARGWCRMHYDRWRSHGDPNHEPYSTTVGYIAYVNPLVCVCPVPLAAAERRWGECQRCHRKPVSLFTLDNQGIIRAAELGYGVLV